jgi:hypothetical protein
MLTLMSSSRRGQALAVDPEEEDQRTGHLNLMGISGGIRWRGHD